MQMKTLVPVEADQPQYCSYSKYQDEYEKFPLYKLHTRIIYQPSFRLIRNRFRVHLSALLETYQNDIK